MLNNALGTIYNNFTNDMSSGATINAATYHNVCHLVLQPGTYIVSGKVNIATNANTNLIQDLYIDKSYAANSITGQQRYLESMYLFNLSKSTTIYLRAYAGTSGTVLARDIYAIKLK